LEVIVVLEKSLETLKRPVYPFTAIMNQSKLKTALILNAIDSTIGGVLLVGPKGTGKSLTVRAFSKVLPETTIVKNCIYRCNPEDPTNMCDSCRSKFLEGEDLHKIKQRMRVVQIPIGATEDRVMGTMDVEKAFQEGLKAFQPGLLAEANQNILFIDEVNLLPDHLVDEILDSASSGWNFVEREGISMSHPSRFILVGTMNPEEGSLRPQIADRFGMQAYAENLSDPKERMDIIKSVEKFSKSPLEFCEMYEERQEELRKKVTAAKELLPKVTVPQKILESTVKLCMTLEVDGYRPDIVTLKAARAIAALNGRTEIGSTDLMEASELTLRHRTRKSGSMAPSSSEEILEAFKETPIKKEVFSSKLGPWWRFGFILKLKKIGLKALLKFIFTTLILFIGLYVFLSYSIEMLNTLLNRPSIFLTLYGQMFLTLFAILLTVLIVRRSRKKYSISVLDLSKLVTSRMLGSQEVITESDESVRSPTVIEYTGKDRTILDRGEKMFGDSLELKEASQKMKPQKRNSQRSQNNQKYLAGKRAKIVTSSTRGRYVWHQLPKERPWDIALGPTIRAAAIHNSAKKLKDVFINIRSQDIRIKRREYRAPFSIILLVDMSFSMTSSIPNLGHAIRSLHRSVYRRRDRVGLIVFKGTEAFILQEPTTNLDLVISKLWKVKASDFTPMALGMLKAWRTLKLEKLRNKDAMLTLIIITDGITNIPLKKPIIKRSKSLLTGAQYDALDVAKLIKKDNVRTIIINTAHNPRETLKSSRIMVRKNFQPYRPTEFLMKISEITKGSYYGLSLGKDVEKKTVVERPEDWFYFQMQKK
jgi:Mg-chelatase subunit ChlI/Mg-chelatase subunit ChlD